ncbi:MAG: DUF4240 domain-containing protein [Dongiaceae bacterium]
MTREKFWSIVDGVNNSASGDMRLKCELLATALRGLPAADVARFCIHFDECDDRAFSWELWAAAHIMGGGCSDDAFANFRATLISLGRRTFEAVVAAPETLTDIEIDPEQAFYEGYQYVAMTVYEEMTGDLPSRGGRAGEIEDEIKPTGKPWREDRVRDLYPRLAMKYAARA